MSDNLTRTSAAPRDHAESDVFRKALKRFQDGLTAEQRVQFQGTTLAHVEAKIKDIQNKYGPEKKLRSMKRLSHFLEVMSQLEQVVKVFLNTHEIVAFVWVRSNTPTSCRFI